MSQERLSQCAKVLGSGGDSGSICTSQGPYVAFVISMIYVLMSTGLIMWLNHNSVTVTTFKSFSYLFWFLLFWFLLFFIFIF